MGKEKDLGMFSDLLDFEDDFDGEEEDNNAEEEESEENEEEESEENEEKDKKKAEEEAEAQRKKNKDAEEARKRRQQAEKEKKEETKVNQLGKQIEECIKKYPDMDLKTLDEDKNFKNFIEGKLLGKKDFTQLYEDYITLRSSFSGRTSEEMHAIYKMKKQASGGTFVTGGGSADQPSDVYTEKELEELLDRIPFMNDAEYSRIESKLDKSIAFYDKKKK